MSIDIDKLRNAGTRSVKVALSSAHAHMLGVKTAFLCHSHQDLVLAQGLETLLNEAGLKVYIDWADPEMPPIPNCETASKIKNKIVEADIFLFLATKSSTASRWCPWEIGYADGRKTIDKIFIVPTIEGSNNYGSEYLDLYRRIDLSYLGQIGVWSPGKNQYYPTEAF